MHKVTLIAGDWIGPEICVHVKNVIEKVGVSIEWQELDTENIDWNALKSEGRVILKSRTAANIENGVLPFSVQLRKELGLYCTVRRAIAIEGTNARFPKMDVVVFRETSEDIYSGFEHQVTEGVFEAVKITTKAACARIAEAAYTYARAEGRKKLTIVHKSNIMKQSDGIFLRTAQEVGKHYPDIKTEEYIVDALCMKLTQDPYRFDVLLTANLFGDIVSDLCSGLAGGIVASPSYSFGYTESGEKIQLYENIHGRVPELVGLDRANPIPMLHTAILMLRDLEEHDAADRISKGISTVLAQNIKTGDLGGESSTTEFIEALLAQL